MVFSLWMALGLMAGAYVSRRFHHIAGARALDFALGVGGAITGGLVCSTLGIEQPAVLIAVSALFAAFGSAVTLVGYRSIFRPA
jgi:uncharacterized membrane protein YeaQ/YmgE (transglycosylase-associated protein family)